MGRGRGLLYQGRDVSVGAWSIATGQTGLQSTWQHGVEAGLIALWAGRWADARGLTCHMGTGLTLARRGSRRRLPRARGLHEQIQSHPWIQSCSVGAGGCELPAERRDSGGPTSRPPCPPSGAQVEKSWGRCRKNGVEGRRVQTEAPGWETEAGQGERKRGSRSSGGRSGGGTDA